MIRGHGKKAATTQPLKAVATATCVGLTCTLDGSKSTGAVKYEWRKEGELPATTEAVWVLPRPGPGTWTRILKVTGADGATDETSVTFTVVASPTPPPPPGPTPVPSPPPPVGFQKPIVPTPTPPTPLRTFYVDAVGGSDANPGTEAAPFQTTTKINAVMQAGDRFYLKGEFTGLHLGNQATADAGTAANPIQFYVWPGQTAWLHCGQGDGYPAIYFFAGMAHWWFNGVKVTGNTGSKDAVLTVPGAHHGTFVGCDFASAQVRLIGATDFSFYDCLWTGVIGTPLDNVGDGIFTQSGSHRLKMVRCNIDFSCHHAAITLGSFQNASMAACDDFYLFDCEIQNPVAGGVNINGKSNGGLIEWCRIHNVGTNSTVPSQTGLFIASHHITARFNSIWGCGREGIKMQGYVFSSFIQSCSNNHVHNNTVFDCKAMPFYMAAANDVDPNLHLANNIIENNIFWKNQTGAVNETNGNYQGNWYSIWINLYNTVNKYAAGAIGGNIIRHNIIARSTVEVGVVLGVRLYGAANQGYTNAAFTAAFPACVNNLPSTDPLFVSEATPDLQLQAGSPAIDAGIAIVGVSYLGAAPDLGVYEKA